MEKSHPQAACSLALGKNYAEFNLLPDGNGQKVLVK
jgi:hypothetical protein